MVYALIFGVLDIIGDKLQHLILEIAPNNLYFEGNYFIYAKNMPKIP